MGRKIKFNHLAIWSLTLMFGISLFVRIYKLGESPRSVNWDEAALGYNAYSLLKTGHDEFGKYFPLSLQSFDDYKPALYAYFAVFPISILSLTDISTRLPSVIFGSLLPIIVAILTTKVSKSIRLGLLTGLLLAFEPWAIHFSRIAFEANVAMVLLYAAICCVLTFKNPVWGIILGVLSMYGYHAQRMVALPIIFIIIYFYNKNESIKFYTKNIFLAFSLLIPLGINFLNQPITSRFAATSIFKLKPFVPDEYMGLYSENLAFLSQIIGQYLAYFSPANLFVRGSTEPVLRIPTMGLVNPVGFVFWLVGMMVFLGNWKKYKSLAVILLVGPLSGVITWNWYSVVRTLTLYPVFSIITAMGLRKMKFAVILFIPFWVYAISNEISYAPVENYGEFQPGFEESVPYVLDKSKTVDKVVVDSPQSAPYIFYNFYGKQDPKIYITKKTDRGTNLGTEKGYTMGNLEFRNILFEDDSLNKNWLIVGTAVSIKDSVANTKDFYDPKGYVSVRVYETPK